MRKILNISLIKNKVLNQYLMGSSGKHWSIFFISFFLNVLITFKGVLIYNHKGSTLE